MAITAQDLHAIQQRLDTLRYDIGALGAHVFDHSGQLIAQAGQHGTFDASAFLVLLGATLNTATQISRILNDTEALDLHLHEGNQYEIYATQITPQVFLALTVERQNNTSRIGVVWLYLRKAITELRALVNRATADSAPLVAPPTPALIDSALANSSPEPPLSRRRLRALATQDQSANSSLEKTDPPPEPKPPTPLTLQDVVSYAQAKELGLLNLDDLEGD